MEYEIGQTIELIHNDEIVQIKVVEDKEKTCNSCFFYNNNNNSSELESPCIRHKYHIREAYCSNLFRSDEKSIIYKQIK